MAQAKIEYVEVPIQEVIVREHIALTLTPEEAEALIAVLAKVGGSPTRSPRKHIAAISEELWKLIGSYYESPAWPCVANSTGVYFEDYPKEQ